MCVCVYIYIYIYIIYLFIYLYYYFIFFQIFFLKENKEFDERLGNVTFIDPCNQCTHSRQLPNINDYTRVSRLQVIGHRKD